MGNYTISGHIGGAVPREKLGRLLSDVSVRHRIDAIGVHIEARSLRAVRIHETHDLWHLASYAIETYEEPGELEDAIKRLHTELGYRHSVTTGLTSDEHHIGVPPDTESETTPSNILRQTATKWGLDASKATGLMLHGEAQQSSTLRRLALIAERDCVENTFEQLRKSQLDDPRITSASMALKALREHCPEAKNTERCLILCVGEESTMIAGFDMEGLYGARSLAICEGDLVHGMMLPFKNADGRIQLTWKEAISLQPNLDITEEVTLDLDDGRQISSAQLIAQMRPQLERLAIEVAKFVRLHTPNGLRSMSMGPLFVTGDGATWKGMSSYLESEVRLETRLLDPCSAFHKARESKDFKDQRDACISEVLDESMDRYRLALPIGFAIDRETAIDLTPTSIKLRRTQAYFRWGVRTMGLTAAAMILFLGWQSDAIGKRLEESADSQLMALETLEEEAGRVELARELQEALAELNQAHDDEATLYPSVYADLKRLVSMLPRDLYLNEFKIARDTSTYAVHLNGLIIDSQEGQRVRLELLNALDSIRKSESEAAVAFSPSQSGWTPFEVTIHKAPPPPTEDKYDDDDELGDEGDDS